MESDTFLLSCSSSVLNQFTLTHQQPIIFAVVYRAPVAYSEFLTDIPEFLSNLVLKTDKIIIVGDFIIHVDNNNDSLSVAVISVLDTIGFSQCVHQPTHCCNHTLDLVLSYGVKM